MKINYEHIIENIPGTVIIFNILDNLLHIKYISDSCIKISGFTANETYQRAKVSPFVDIYKDDKYLFMNLFNDEIRDNLTLEYRIICKDGNYKWVRLELSKVIEDNEIFYYGFFSDINDEYIKKQIQKEKEERNNKERQLLQQMYQSILDETKAMITVIDAKTYEIVYANKMAIEAAKVNHSYIGSTCYKKIHNRETPCSNCLLLKNQNIERVEINYHNRIYNMIKKQFIWNGRDALLEYSEDVTEQKEYQRIEIELNTEKQLGKAKLDFFARMNHDMLTPLNGILGSVTLALSLNNIQDDMHECLNDIKISSEFLLTLINNIKELSNIENHSIQLNPIKIRYNEILIILKKMFESSCIKKEITLNIELLKDDIYLNIDPMRYIQIIFNIISNAIKFSPYNSNINCYLEYQRIDNNMDCKFHVIDNGIGIPKNMQENLFKPYSSKHNNSSKQGTGLGLSIANNLAKMMGGEIIVSSVVNKGTEVVVHTIFDIADSKISKEKEVINLDEYKDMKLLLCEDHPLNAKITINLLNKYGIEVHHALNGKEGIDMFSNSLLYYYDAIIMDIRMPVINGIEATKSIRLLSRNDAKDIPIIALSANSTNIDIENSIRAGMNKHISKPIKINELLTSLLYYVNIYRGKC